MTKPFRAHNARGKLDAARRPGRCLSTAPRHSVQQILDCPPQKFGDDTCWQALGVCNDGRGPACFDGNKPISVAASRLPCLKEILLKRTSRQYWLKETTNSDVVSSKCRVAESGREGRLTRPPLPLNPLFTMAIQCIPKPCSCRIKGQEFGVRKGYTHPKQATCPFAVHDFPMTRFGTCCSFKMDAAQSHLYIFGEDVLAERMDYSMTAEQALYFAEDLRRTMGRLEARYQGAACKPEGGWYVRYWHKNKTEKVYKRRSTFEDAVAAIGQAATWYELVGRLGYGVAVK